MLLNSARIINNDYFVLIVINETPKQIAIIGSGPISLFEALYQSKLGNQVVVFEEREQVGGAWSTVQYDGKTYELGCHIWDVQKQTYSFIEQFLDDKLKHLKPSPIIIYKNKKLPYDWKNNIILLKLFINNFKEYLTIRKQLKPVIINRKYLYPKGGSAQLVNKLEAELTKNKAEIRFESKIKRVSKKNDVWELHEDDAIHYFDELIISSMSMVKEISFDNQKIIPKHKETVFTHFHLIVKGKIPNPISYIRVMNHQFIHRISDITEYSNNDDHVFSIGIFKDKIDMSSDSEIASFIFFYLKEQKFVSKSAKLIKFFENDYTSHTIDKDQRIVIENLDDSLTLLKSTNFSYGIGEHVERWSKEI